jgi:hypothetical protein
MLKRLLRRDSVFAGVLLAETGDLMNSDGAALVAQRVRSGARLRR